MEEADFNFETDVKQKVHQFSYFAYGEASVHFLSLSKALTGLERMKNYARHAFLAAADRQAIQSVAQDVKEVFDELLDYFGKAVGLIKACGNKDVQKHVHLVEEAYISLSLYSEAVQKAAKDEGLASIEERPYSIGVSENADD